MATSFGPILPAPVRDFFVFDLTTQIGPTGAITGVAWVCSVEAYSPTPDPDAGDRIIGTPTFDSYKTSALCGDMVDQVIYELKVTASIDDGRILVTSGEVLCAEEPAAMAPIVIDGVVQFNYLHFITQYPEFANMDPDMAQAYWDEACILFRNDLTSPEQDYTNRREILELMTAHCIALFAPAPYGKGSGASSVGRVTSKSVNGVSVSYDVNFPGTSGTETWWLQTQYGAKAWRILAPYRTMHYLPPYFSHLPRRPAVPFPYSWRW